MKPWVVFTLFCNSVLFLIVFFFLVYQKETLREHGTLVLLPLAPRDPRSLFQGDYMNLNYNFFEVVTDKTFPKRGYLVFTIQDGILIPQRLEGSADKRKKGEYQIRYFSDGNTIRIGAESWFFQEGTGALYEQAKYAGLHFFPESDAGDKLLIGLYDENRLKIEHKSN